MPSTLRLSGSGRRVVAAASLLTVAVLGGCGDDTDAAPAPGFGSLCVALAAADSGDVASARGAFEHGPLHELADATVADDRAVAARLLVAKEAVESDLGDAAVPAARLAEDLRALIDATAEASAATDGPAPARCEEQRR